MKGAAPSNTGTGSGLLVVISGPSGVGKTTIVRHVRDALGAGLSVSVTTRPRSDSEVDGVDYHFVDEAEFAHQRDAGALLEWAEYLGQCYGTPRRPVERAIAEGRIMLLEIDVQGGMQVKRSMPEAFAVFILPPGEDDLLKRLRNRRREPEEAIQRRFAKARSEIAMATDCGLYDAFVVNRDLDAACRETLALIEQRIAGACG